MEDKDQTRDEKGHTPRIIVGEKRNTNARYEFKSHSKENQFLTYQASVYIQNSQRILNQMFFSYLNQLSLFWIMERKGSIRLRHIFTVAFLLFLASVGALTLRE